MNIVWKLLRKKCNESQNRHINRKKCSPSTKKKKRSSPRFRLTKTSAHNGCCYYKLLLNNVCTSLDSTWLIPDWPYDRSKVILNIGDCFPSGKRMHFSRNLFIFFFLGWPCIIPYIVWCAPRLGRILCLYERYKYHNVWQTHRVHQQKKNNKKKSRSLYRVVQCFERCS